jgi:hypothetical protein
MYVQIGNDNALEGYRDPTSDDPDAVRYRAMDGQQVTTLNFPEDTGLQEAFSATVTALGYHMAQDAKPSWIQSDSAGLQALLQEHFGITDSQNTRPKTWGKDTTAAYVGT